MVVLWVQPALAERVPLWWPYRPGLALLEREARRVARYIYNIIYIYIYTNTYVYLDGFALLEREACLVARERGLLPLLPCFYA